MNGKREHTGSGPENHRAKRQEEHEQKLPAPQAMYEAESGGRSNQRRIMDDSER